MIKFILAVLILIGVDYDPGFGAAFVRYDVFDSVPVDPVVADPVAIVYVSDGVASEIQREEFEGLKIQWKLTGHPDWVKSLPTTHFEKDGRWWAATGVITKERFDRLRGKKPPRRFGYQIRFDDHQWTFPGDIRTHLMGGMHGFSAAELEGYSTRDLIRIHNYEHQNGRPRLYYNRTSSTPRTRNYCPT